MAPNHRNRAQTRVSVIIRCFNEEKHIGDLLGELSRQTVEDKEIIVVDSGSFDNTVAVVRRFPVKLIQINPADFTFGYSLNRGCGAASGEILVIASAHVLPRRSDWLEQLIAPFADPRIALVYGRQMGNSKTKFSEEQLFYKQYPPDSNLRQKTPFCNNANAAIRRSLWQEHRYDEALSGLEDLEWAKWALEQGYEIAYNADAEIIHIHEETPRKIFNRYKREAIALKRIFPDSHLTFWQFLSLWITNSAFDLMRATKRGILFRNLFDILMFRTMQYVGTYQGIHYRSPLTHDMIVQFYYPRKFARLQRHLGEPAPSVQTAQKPQ